MNSKIIDKRQLVDRIKRLRQRGRRVVFTNGCFDILHAGHVRYLRDARAQGDVLIVGLNSDRSVKVVKGPQRPIVPQDQRAEVLAAIESVSYVVVFDEPDPLDLIQALRPDVLVKGEDWPESQIVGADFVREIGGRIFRSPLAGGVSTTDIIERILNIFLKT